MGKNVKSKSASPGTPGLRAVVYLRVSTAGQAERGMGLETQRDRVRAFAEAKGLDLRGVVQEAASGGVRDGEDFSYEHRPVLLSLVERAERREYDALIVARFDRLSRDYATLIVGYNGTACGCSQRPRKTGTGRSRSSCAGSSRSWRSSNAR